MPFPHFLLWWKKSPVNNGFLQNHTCCCWTGPGLLCVNGQINGITAAKLLLLAPVFTWLYWMFTLIQIFKSFLVLFDWDCKAGPAVAAVLAWIKMEVELPSLCGEFVSWFGLKFWSVFDLLKLGCPIRPLRYCGSIACFFWQRGHCTCTHNGSF